MSQCKATKPNGERCHAHAGESGLCFLHDPDRRKEATQARIKGGTKYEAKPSGEPIEPPQTEAEVLDIISKCIAATWSGDMDHKKSKAVRDLCLLQLRVIKDAREAEKRDGGGDDFSTMSGEELRKLALEMTNGQDG